MIIHLLRTHNHLRLLALALWWVSVLHKIMSEDSIQELRHRGAVSVESSVSTGASAVGPLAEWRACIIIIQ